MSCYPSEKQKLLQLTIKTRIVIKAYYLLLILSKIILTMPLVGTTLLTEFCNYTEIFHISALFYYTYEYRIYGIIVMNKTNQSSISFIFSQNFTTATYHTLFERKNIYYKVKENTHKNTNVKISKIIMWIRLLALHDLLQ